MRLKAMLAVLVLAVFASCAVASITLTSPYTVSVGGTVIETDAAMAVTGVAFDVTRNALQIQYAFGSMTNGVFTRGTVPGGVMSINLTTGAYTAPNGAHSTLNAGQMTAVHNEVDSIRNGAENLVKGAGIVAGTQVPWVN